MTIIQGIVFDLDGTLVDSLVDIANACNEVLASAGYPTHPLDAFRTLVGDGVTMLFERALPASANDAETVNARVREFSVVYPRHLDQETRPYAGIGDMLMELKERGVRMGVLSNKPHPFTVECVARCLPGDCFDPVLGQSNLMPRKPDPAGAVEIARRWQLSPAQIAFVGDTSVDMQTAISAGMLAIGVEWGFRSRDELERHGAQEIVAAPAGIVELVGV